MRHREICSLIISQFHGMGIRKVLKTFSNLTREAYKHNPIVYLHIVAV